MTSIAKQQQQTNKNRSSQCLSYNEQRERENQSGKNTKRGSDPPPPIPRPAKHKRTATRSTNLSRPRGRKSGHHLQFNVTQRSRAPRDPASACNGLKWRGDGAGDSVLHVLSSSGHLCTARDSCRASSPLLKCRPLTGTVHGAMRDRWAPLSHPTAATDSSSKETSFSLVPEPPWIPDSI